MKWLAQHRFLILLFALTLLLVIYPLMHDVFRETLLYDVLQGGVVLAGILAIFTQQRMRLLFVAIAVPFFAVSWTGHILPSANHPLPLILYHGSAALFLSYAVVEILRSIYQDETITADSVSGGFCGYLLLGITFSHLFSILEAVQPGSFHADPTLLEFLGDLHQRHYNLTYFSLITLTTVGYGDIAPQTGAARGLVSVEAVAGQFYIAVLIAELIGRRVASAKGGVTGSKAA